MLQVTQLSMFVARNDGSFFLEWGSAAGGGTDLKLHLVPAVGGRGFGLQAEVFHFRTEVSKFSSGSLEEKNTAAWRPPPRKITE